MPSNGEKDNNKGEKSSQGGKKNLRHMDNLDYNNYKNC